MTATGIGFVQRHEEEAKTGALYTSIEVYLKRRFGKVRQKLNPGLKWLLTGRYDIPRFLDHPEYRIKNGLKTITARPYDLDLEQLEELIALAKAKSLKLFIWTPSNYNLDTLLVVLTQEQYTDVQPPSQH